MNRANSISQFGMRLAIVSFVAVSITNTALATDEAVEIVKAANASLRQGDIESAIDKYDAAIATGFTDPRITYNKAVALFRKGEVDAASQLFAQVLSSDSVLTAKARYNLGNSAYSQAIQLKETDSQAAIQKLKQAIKHYRSALLSDSSDADARANIELASRLIRQLNKKEQQQNQNSQQQEQQSQNGEQQEPQNQDSQNQDQKSQENSDQSEDQQKQNEDSESESNQQPEQQHQEGQDESQQQESSQQNSDDSQDDSETNSEQSSQSDSQQDEASSDKSNRTDRDQQQETADENVSDEQAEYQKGEKPPEGELKPIQKQNTEDTKNGKPQPFKEGQKMTMQEAQKLLQAVRDRELRRRLQKLRQTRSRRVRVERDW